MAKQASKSAIHRVTNQVEMNLDQEWLQDPTSTYIGLTAGVYSSDR